MKIYGKLNHTTYECKYHVVFISKYRKKTLYKSLRNYLGEIFHELANHKECKIEEYIKKQEIEDKRVEQLSLFDNN